MKKLIALLFVAFLALGLVACAEDEPSYEYGYGVGYGLVHGHYVGVVKVVLDKDDVVVNVQFEEYYLPYNAGQVAYTPVEGVAQPADILTVVGSRGTSYFAKYMSVNGVLFTGAVQGESGAQVIEYTAPGVGNIEEWVTVEANAKAYVEAVEAGLVFIANANGTKSSYEHGNANVKLGWTKSATGYWTYDTRNARLYPLGWGGNMAALAEALVGTKIDAVETDLVKDGTWKIGTIVTGATMSDFVDYYKLAQRGYANALAGKK